MAARSLYQSFARRAVCPCIDTDYNGVITMADLTVTMTTTRRRALSQEEIEARIRMCVAHLREFAAQTAVEELPVLRSPNGMRTKALSGLRRTMMCSIGWRISTAFTARSFRDTEFRIVEALT